MNYIKSLIALVATFLLVGCASVQQKPAMDYKTKQGTLQLIAAMMYCTDVFTPADMLLSRQVLRHTLNRYSDTLEDLYTSPDMPSAEVTIAACPMLKNIIDTKHKLNGMIPAPQYAPVVPPQPAYVPRTVCNRIGFQTICSTY